MKFLRFQKVDLQALVNAERSANSCNNRRLHRRWATIVSALPTTTLQVALGTPKILPNALLCPQSPPNRSLCSPLCPSSKATAWVFAFADHFYRPSAGTSINLQHQFDIRYLWRIIFADNCYWLLFSCIFVYIGFNFSRICFSSVSH